MTVSTTIEISVGIEGQGYFRVLVDPTTTMQQVLFSRQFRDYLSNNSMPPALVHRLCALTADGRHIELSETVESLGLQAGATIHFTPAAAAAANNEVPWPEFADRPPAVEVSPDYLQRIVAVVDENANAVRHSLPADSQPMVPNVSQLSNGFEGVSCSPADYAEVNQPPRQLNDLSTFCEHTAPQAVLRMSPDLREAFEAFIDAAVTMLVNINGRTTNPEIEAKLLRIMHQITDMPNKISHDNELADIIAPFKAQLEQRVPQIVALRDDFDRATNQGDVNGIWEKVNALSGEFDQMAAICSACGTSISQHVAQFDGFQDPRSSYNDFCDSIVQQVYVLESSAARCQALIAKLRQNQLAHAAAVEESCVQLTGKIEAAQARKNFEHERQVALIAQIKELVNQYLTSAANEERCNAKMLEAQQEKQRIESRGAEVSRNIDTMIDTLSRKIDDDTLLTTNLNMVHTAAKSTTDHFAQVTLARDAAVKQAVVDNAATCCKYTGQAFQLTTTAYRASAQEAQHHEKDRANLNTRLLVCQLQQDFSGSARCNQRLNELDQQVGPCAERIHRYSEQREKLNSLWIASMHTAQQAASTQQWCEPPSASKAETPAADAGDAIAPLHITTHLGASFTFEHPMIEIRREDLIREEQLAALKLKHREGGYESD